MWIKMICLSTLLFFPFNSFSPQRAMFVHLWLERFSSENWRKIIKLVISCVHYRKKGIQRMKTFLDFFISRDIELTFTGRRCPHFFNPCDLLLLLAIVSWAASELCRYFAWLWIAPFPYFIHDSRSICIPKNGPETKSRSGGGNWTFHSSTSTWLLVIYRGEMSKMSIECLSSQEHAHFIVFLLNLHACFHVIKIQLAIIWLSR